jgi:hypothetical protein
MPIRVCLKVCLGNVLKVDILVCLKVCLRGICLKVCPKKYVLRYAYKGMS